MRRQSPMVSTGLFPHWKAGTRLWRFTADSLCSVLYCSPFQVFRLLRERGCKLARVWLGGNSLAEADQWVWPDGQQVSEESGGMWGRGEPAPGRGECMMLAETEWEAADCLDDKSVEAFLAHHKPADSTKPHTRPTPKPTKPLSTKRTTIVVPTETTHPGEMQTPS